MCEKHEIQEFFKRHSLQIINVGSLSSFIPLNSLTKRVKKKFEHVAKMSEVALINFSLSKVVHETIKGKFHPTRLMNGLQILCSCHIYPIIRNPQISKVFNQTFRKKKFLLFLCICFETCKVNSRTQNNCSLHKCTFSRQKISSYLHLFHTDEKIKRI